MLRPRLALVLCVIASLLGTLGTAATFDNPLSHTGWVSGTSPSGLNWTAVATGTALPIRSSGAQDKMAGAVAYFNTRNGQVQLDPKGWNISLFNLTYTSGTVNVTGSTTGPLFYATGTSPTTNIVSGSTGLANQKTLPAGTWTLITAMPSRVAGTVSLTRSPTLTTSYDPGNGAANGNSPYATDPSGTAPTPGWFNQPWAFPADLVRSGSVSAMTMANWRVFGVVGNANANILGFGNYQSVFQYAVDGITGNQVGAFIPYASTASLTWNTTSGTWSTSSTDWTGNASTFVNGDTVTFDGSSGGTVTLSGTLQPAAVVVSATAGTYTFSGGAGNLIAGSTSLAKSGAGTLVLTAADTYTGPTTVSGGTLVVNGSLVNSAVTVGSGATLGGSGTIGSSVTVQSGGTIAPGNSPGLLTVGSLDLQAGSTTLMQIIGSGSGAGTAGIDYDKLLITSSGGLGYGGTLDLDFANTLAFDDGTTFDLIGFTGSAIRNFSSVVSTGSGGYASLVFSGAGGVWTAVAGSQLLTFSELTGQLQFTANGTPVPEIDPNSLASVLAVLAGTLGLVERRVRRRSGG